MVLAPIQTLAQTLADCQAQLQQKKSCFQQAKYGAMGATANSSPDIIKEAFKQCLTDNGCGMSQCLIQQLGFDPKQRTQQCMTAAGFPDQGDDGHHGGGGHPGGPRGGNMLSMFQRICANGNMQGALQCIKDKTGIDVQTVDDNAVRQAMCAVQANCRAFLSDACTPTLQQNMIERKKAMCRCKQALNAEVGEDKLRQAFQACGQNMGGGPPQGMPPMGGRGGRFGMQQNCDLIGSNMNMMNREPDFCTQNAPIEV